MSPVPLVPTQALQQAVNQSDREMALRNLVELLGDRRHGQSERVAEDQLTQQKILIALAPLRDAVEKLKVMNEVYEQHLREINPQLYLPVSAGLFRSRNSMSAIQRDQIRTLKVTYRFVVSKFYQQPAVQEELARSPAITQLTDMQQALAHFRLQPIDGRSRVLRP